MDVRLCRPAGVLAIVLTGCDGPPIPACPVTPPNASLPPDEETASPDTLGNGDLWTVLWPDGRIVFEPGGPGKIRSDGSLAMKFPFWRGETAEGDLHVTGRRLDGAAPAMTAEIPEGYGDRGLRSSALIFPSAGCWEVTASVGDHQLTFTTEVVVREAPDG